jgi:hypothetical protein
LTFLLIMVFTAKAQAYPERRIWIFEQLSLPPVPTLADQSRNQFSLRATNYMDSISTQASGLIDATYFEVGVKAAQREYLMLTDQGRLLSSSLSGLAQNASLEIARNFSSRDNIYARLSGEYTQFFPSNERWVKFAIDSGIFNRPDQPWDLTLHLAYLSSIPRIGDFIQVFGETAKVFDLGTNRLRVGGFIYWTLRVHDTPAALPGGDPIDYEHILFSFGPSVELQTQRSGTFKLSVPLRLWVDQEEFYLTDGLTVAVGYPSNLATPDLMLSWGLAF